MGTAMVDAVIISRHVMMLLSLEGKEDLDSAPDRRTHAS